MGKVELNLSDRIATKGFSRSGLVVERIVLAENYEIKGLRYRHSTPGKGQAAVALLTPQPQSPLRKFYIASVRRQDVPGHRSRRGDPSP